jgi:hypothetical protein
MDAHVGHRQFDKRARAQTDGKILVTSVVIFSSVGCSVLLLASTLNGKPLLDKSDGSWHWRGAE